MTGNRLQACGGKTLLFVHMAECKNLLNYQSNNSYQTKKPIHFNEISLASFVGMRFAH
jgi:hypothetical protein